MLSEEHIPLFLLKVQWPKYYKEFILSLNVIWTGLCDFLRHLYNSTSRRKGEKDLFLFPVVVTILFSFLG